MTCSWADRSVCDLLMRKVFYTASQRVSPAAARGLVSDGSASELETDVEDFVPVNSFRRKVTHRRNESTDPSIHTEIAADMGAAPKRVRRNGGATVKQRQVSKESRDVVGRKPLQKACSKGDIDRVREILQDSPYLEDRDYAGTTALHTAASEGHSEIVKVLVEAGAVPDVRSGPQELDTPLIDAAANADYSIVKILLEAGSDPRVTNSCGRIALDFAIEAGEVDNRIVDALNQRTKTLRRDGVPVINSPDSPAAPEGLFPPGFSGVKHQTAPAFLDVSKRSSRAEIIKHAANGNLVFVGSALERGWRPNAEALVKAARHGHTEVVGLLLAFGLSADQKHEGTTPLKEAVTRAHFSTAKLLVESGARIGADVPELVQDFHADDPIRKLVMGSSDSHTSHSQESPKEELTASTAPLVAAESVEESKEVSTKNESENKDSPKDELDDESRLSNDTESASSKNQDIPNGRINFTSDNESTDTTSAKETVAQPHAKQADNLNSSSTTNTPPAISKPTIIAKTEELRPNTPPIPIEVWEERSHELNELARLKEKQRRDREARMLESLAMGARWKSEPTTADSSRSSFANSPSSDTNSNSESYEPNNSGAKSSECPSANNSGKSTPKLSPSSPGPSGVGTSVTSAVGSPSDSSMNLSEISSVNFSVGSKSDHQTPNGNERLNTNSPDAGSSSGSASLTAIEPISVSHLPWSLRRLAYTGKPQAVLPLLVHVISGTNYFIDIQVALALGDPKLHSKYPEIPKVTITSSQKTLLWPFCRSWLCRPGSTSEEIAACRQSFFAMILCWVPVESSLSNMFTARPPMLSIQLELPSVVTKTNLRSTNLPIRWQHKIKAGW